MSAELFIAIRLEELPAGMVRPALKGLAAAVTRAIAGVSHGAVTTWATPRRLAVSIADVAPAREAVERTVTGPPAARAFNDGTPTKVAIGFARSKGVELSALTIVEIEGRGEVVAATVREGGETVVDLISEGIGKIITSIPFKKSMTWGAGTLKFGRPLHGIIATYGSQVIPGEVHGVVLGNTTLGHRLCPEPLTVTGHADWLFGLRERKVEPDLDVRKAAIQRLLEAAATRLEADPIVEDALLEEVTHLVEWPALVLGTFDEDLLDLPPRLLVTAMKVHQRYFPVHRDGALTNQFVVISNNPFGDHDLIAEGNARVLRARFYDARFFLAEDRKHSLVALSEQLPRMRWIRGLGHMGDKSQRLAGAAGVLVELLGGEAVHAIQAGSLAKADLASQMVGEFADLQGHMGRIYANDAGIEPEVAEAIEDHYLPRFSGDTLPAGVTSAAVALADRLDSLVGCFGVGMEPKGGDPQGLRRAALGLVLIVLHHGVRVDLGDLMDRTITAFHAYARTNAERFGKWTTARGEESSARDAEALSESLVAFVIARYRASKVAEGLSGDLVDAVLASREHHGGNDLLVLDRKLDALRGIAGTSDFRPIMETFKRVLNITRGEDAPPPSLSDCTLPAEADLLVAVDAAEGAFAGAVERLAFDDAMATILGLRAPVERFFDDVLVNDPDPAVKAVRIGLLLRIARIFLRVADFSRITTR